MKAIKEYFGTVLIVIFVVLMTLAVCLSIVGVTSAEFCIYLLAGSFMGTLVVMVITFE